MVTLEDTEVASRWPSGRLWRRRRAGRSVGHHISQWGRPRLFRHVNILLILPTSSSPREPILLLPQMLGQVPSHAEPSGLSLWPRPWSGDTKCDWLLGQVP